MPGMSAPREPGPDATPDEVHDWLMSLGGDRAWLWLDSPRGSIHRLTAQRIATTLRLIERGGLPPEYAWQAALVVHPEQRKRVVVPDELRRTPHQVAPAAQAADFRNGELSDTVPTLQRGGQGVSLNSVPGVVVEK